MTSSVAAANLVAVAWQRRSAAAVDLHARRCSAALTVLLFSTVLLQRITLPVGGAQMSVVVLVAYAVMAFLAFSRAIDLDRLNAQFYLCAAALCVTAVMFSLSLSGDGSLGSLGFLLLIYAPFVIRLHPPLRHLYWPLLRRFTNLMIATALIGVATMGAQILGVWTYVDLIREVVPGQYLASGYNTAYPIVYGSPLIKSTGFVFYEPSFFSQFLALAVVITLIRQERVWRVLVLLLALACSVSGTGLLLLMGGLAVLAARRGPGWALRLMALGMLAIALVSMSPLGDAFLARTGEASNQESSGSLRFVQPYQFAENALDEPQLALIGLGPGGADAEADRVFAATGRPIAFSSLLKLVLEYGIPAGLCFNAFLLVMFARGTPSLTLTVCVLLFHLLLSGALLQPPTVYLAMLLTTTFARPEEGVVHPGRRASGALPSGLRREMEGAGGAHC